MRICKEISKRNKCLSAGFSLLFGLCIFLFFASLYPNHLFYQEQNQLFLFTAGYLFERTSFPGGVCAYMSSFLLQFYIYSRLGALIISLLLVLLHRINLYTLHKLGVAGIYSAVSIVPSLLYWMLLCDETYLLSILIAQIFAAAFMIIYFNISNTTVRIMYALCTLIILYVLAGGIYWTFGAFAILVEVLYFRQLSKRKCALFFIVSTMLIIALPLISKYILMMPYPLRQLWRGIGYYRYTTAFPSIIFAVWSIVVCFPFLIRYLSKSPQNKSAVSTILIGGVTFIILIYASFDKTKEREMEYDYNLRYNLWNRIIKLSQESSPVNPIEMAIVNLSLAQTGKMGDKMFQYSQNNPEALLPPFSEDFNIAFAIADIYYHLGMVNISQHLTFEGMEAIPDTQKSGRAMKRLAEISLINGKIEIACKYLKLLQHTIFYRVWSRNTLEYIRDNKLSSETEWEKIRTIKPETEFIFSGNNKTVILQSLVNDHPDNRIASEYLIAYALLNKDIYTFTRSLSLMEKWYSNRIPVHYQEALLLAWTLDGNAIDNIPFTISGELTQKFNNFIKTYNQNPDRALLNAFSNTYWHYYYFKAIK